jgi:hypothetical protein
MRRCTAPKTGVAKIKISGRQKYKGQSFLVLQNVAKQLTNQAAQKRFTPCCFPCETVGFEVLLFIFRNGKGGKNPNHPNVVHVIVPPM